MFTRRTPTPDKKVLRALFHSKPLVPRYEQVRLPQHLTDGERRFFADFEEFAAVVNWWFSDEHVNAPWRLQELPADGHLGLSEEPCYGRSYAVSHNQVRLGTLELKHGYNYGPNEQRVWTAVKLSGVRLLTFETLEGFFVAIAEHLSDRRSDEHSLITRQIDRALMRVLWQTLHVSESGFDGTDLGEIELHFQSAAGWYFVRIPQLSPEAIEF